MRLRGPRRDLWQRNAFTAIAGLWQAYIDAMRGRPLESHDIPALMSLYKTGRFVTAPKPHDDNPIDGCGYLALAGELSTQVDTV